MRILVIDDEVVIRKGLIKLLGMITFNDLIIEEAKNGEEALQKMKMNKPDLLVTDIHMPVLNGLDFIDTVRETYSDIEIVILTGFAEFEYVQRALRNSVTDYLLKPISQQKLEEVISRILLKDPARWISKIDMNDVRKIKETAQNLAKSTIAENKIELEQTFKEWQEYCEKSGFSLHEIKRLMGQMQLFYQSEFYQTLNYYPSSFLSSINQQATTSNQLFDLWFKSLLEHMEFISEQKSPKNKRIVEEVVHYISENFHDPNLSIKKIADHCGVTTAYLSTIYRKVMKQPLTQYIIEYRLEQAKERLKADYKTKINLIAEECGFGDYPYFSKIFKKNIGISPLEYREKVT